MQQEQSTKKITNIRNNNRVRTKTLKRTHFMLGQEKKIHKRPEQTTHKQNKQTCENVHNARQQTHKNKQYTLHLPPHLSLWIKSSAK